MPRPGGEGTGGATRHMSGGLSCLGMWKESSWQSMNLREDRFQVQSKMSLLSDLGRVTYLCEAMVSSSPKSYAITIRGSRGQCLLSVRLW